MKKRVALSWSGGKDGCLALDVLIKQGIEAACLLTTVPSEIGRTFGHGEKTEMIKLQAEALAVPVQFIPCTFDNYTDSFIKALKQYKEQYQLEGIAFGDLYLEGHREWGEKAASASGLEAIYPLWSKKEQAMHALAAFIHSGYQARVIRIREDMLDQSWLGRELNFSFYEDIKTKDICPMGESGEYHTFVYDGPLFQKKIALEKPEILELETTKKLEFQQCHLLNKDFE